MFVSFITMYCACLVLAPCFTSTRKASSYTSLSFRLLLFVLVSRRNIRSSTFFVILHLNDMYESSCVSYESSVGGSTVVRLSPITWRFSGTSALACDAMVCSVQSFWSWLERPFAY
ncbi:hypothetical protein AC1031_019382 [Aphanomyces cochlioides]|nr:hypothetical protein AC1031_019382 [Aphanomyces cochlioides]